MEPYARKLFHAVGVVIVAAYWYLPIRQEQAAAVCLGVAALLALVDLFRARSPAVQALFFKLLGKITAEKDRTGLNGSTLYFTGCGLTILLFDKPIACAGILCLALGDALAAVVGMSVKSPQWKGSSVAGSTTCFVVCTAVCWLFVGFPLALVGGLAATVLEAVSGSKNDNLLIPIGTAAALWLVA
ncbi:MAG: diacylglycerol/polyprenol kinase family protein [Planctomycetota bacterium]